MRSKFKIGLVVVSCMLVMGLITRLYQELLDAYEQSGSLTDLEYSWFFRLLLNLAGYSMIMAPGYILYKYLDKTNYFDNISSKSAVSRVLLLCFRPAEELPETSAPSPAPAPVRHDALELAFCFTGLMAAYLVWGLLQEKIMTQSYVLRDGRAVRFSDAQFLVLVNRAAALLAAAAWLRRCGRPLLVAPLAHFSLAALANVLSAWCQYEALKYLSFPTQVLSKSCKVLPVMLMGKLVSRNRYETYEYATAVLISCGMVLFMLGGGAGAGAGAGGAGAPHWAVTSGGLALLALYMASDAFTSSWQQALFARTRCRPLQMLCCVNLFSAGLAGAALLRHDAARHALLSHAGFLCDAALLSASSAAGQLLIYRTIERFGAVVFTIIMTLRQAVSILLSCAVYGHAVSASGAAGVALVFAAVPLRLYCARRARRKRGRTDV